MRAPVAKAIVTARRRRRTADRLNFPALWARRELRNLGRLPGRELGRTVHGTAILTTTRKNSCSIQHSHIWPRWASACRTKEKGPARCGPFQGWRRGRDSNPRADYSARRFRGAPVTTTSVPLLVVRTALPEERLDHVAAIGFEHLARRLQPMIQRRVFVRPHRRLDCAGLRLLR